MCAVLPVDGKEIQIFKRDFLKDCFVSVKQGAQGTNIFSATVCNGYKYVCMTRNTSRQKVKTHSQV